MASPADCRHFGGGTADSDRTRRDAIGSRLMTEDEFRGVFSALTENPNGHFPWQWALYERFVSGRDNIPSACTLPTGLGKTSVIAIWLIALATPQTRIPRRLVYVVNRRTVVDQSTDEAR